MSSLKNCLLVMQTVLYSLSVNIHRVVFLISKCLKCYQIGRKIFIKGGVVVGGGGAGINKSHNSFQSLKAFFSLWSHVRLNTGDGDRTFILPMGCLQTVDFTSCLRCFLFTSDISKREKKALPPLCASAFFWVVFFPPLPCPVPPPCPVLCTHCSACSSGETEEIAVLLIR